MSVHAWTSPGSASSLSQPSSSPASLMSEMPDLDDFEDIASPVSPNWTPPTPPGANCAHPLEESGEGYKPDDSLSDDSASSTSHENAPGGEPALDASFTTVSAGTVTVLVEGHPYVVDRVLFECQSARFDEALAAQPRTSIAFDGVSRADFEVLLRAILPKERGERGSFSEDDWIAILRLTDVWDFKHFRDESIAYLDTTVSSPRRISLGRDHKLPEWVEEGIAALCVRPEPINDAEEVWLEKRDLRFLIDIRPFTLNGETPAATLKDDAQFHNRFSEISPKERLLETFDCSFSDGIAYPGAIYITKNHVCFSSGFLGRTQMLFPFTEIVDFEKAWTLGIVPNAIIVETIDGARKKFCSFHTRDTTLRLLQALHRFARCASE